MSIKLEWDVSEAPNDDDGTPRDTAINRGPDSLGKSNNEVSSQRARQAKALAGRPGRWPWWLVGAALLAVVAGGGLWFFTQAGWQSVNNDIAAAVKYEDQQAAQGATNLLLNVQDQGNADWLSVRRDESLARQPAPLPVPMLNFGQATLKLADLTAIDADFVAADVSRQFSAPDGQTLTFTLPQFYRRGADNAWLRSAPPGSFWGNWLDWQGALLVVRYSERDAAFVNQVAPALEQRLADACAVWTGGCPSQSPIKLYLSGFVGSLEYNPLSNVEVRIELGNSTGTAVTPADYFLGIPSPQIAGIPSDDAGRNYLTDYLAVRLIASLARHVSTSPDGYYERTAQAIQALDLSGADPGYVVVGRRQHDTSSEAPLQFPQANGFPGRGQAGFTGRVVWYVTAVGDTLTSIAAHFSTSVGAIEHVNRLGNTDHLPTGVRLIIPLFTPGATTTAP